MTDQEKISQATSTITAPPGRSPRIFISYAHENREHKENVSRLAEILRDKGLDVFLDRWNKTPRLDWNQTVTNQIRDADFVLAMASARYRTVAEGNVPPGQNRGVQHELVIIRELLNSDRSVWLPKILPVILPDWTIADVPTVLQPTTANHCQVTEISERGLTELIELLTSAPGDARPRSSGTREWHTGSGIRRKLSAFTARRSAMSISAVTAASITIGAAVTMSGPFDAGTGPGPGPAISTPGSPTCGQIIINSTCVIEIRNYLHQLDESAQTDDELKAELAKDATAAPATHGPWPFIVVDTVGRSGVDDGLYARTTNQLNAVRLGIAQGRSLVWADCVATSDFAPPTGSLTDVGPLWLKVRWKPVGPNERSTSEPTETQQAWMYRGGFVPFKHNGDIPTCP